MAGNLNLKTGFEKKKIAWPWLRDKRRDAKRRPVIFISFLVNSSDREKRRRKSGSLEATTNN